MNDIREQIERLRNSKYLLDENCKEVYVSDCARTMEKLLAEIERLRAHIEWIGANTDSPSTALYCHAALELEEDYE